MKKFKAQIRDWPDTDRRTAFCFLPPGERVRLEVYVNYWHYYPASSLGSVVAIKQTWAVEPTFTDYEPFNDAGTFNTESFEYGLLPDGDGLWMELDVPEEETSFRFTGYSWVYHCGNTNKRKRAGSYTVMVFSTLEHDEKYDSIRLAEATK